MKALKVFCIIFTVVAVMVTGLMFAFNRFLNSEVKGVSDEHKSQIATVQTVGNEYVYTIKDSEFKAMPETEYLKTMNQAKDGTSYAAVGGGVLTVLFIVGAVASGKAAKRRNSGFAAA